MWEYTVRLILSTPKGGENVQKIGQSEKNECMQFISPSDSNHLRRI